MPNKYTFALSSARNLLLEEMSGEYVDPFAGMNSPAHITNDINADCPTTFHRDATEFLESLQTNAFDGALFDPPYSAFQVVKSYGLRSDGEPRLEQLHSRCKDDLSRLVRPGGKVICFGWNSSGMGEKRGFLLQRVLLICHGGAHNDTIVTVETKIQSSFDFGVDFEVRK
jgi:hypothetical protein